MRICVLGNSHVASLKMGWDDIAAQYPSIQMVFFASGRNGLRALRLVGASLVSRDAKVSRDITFTSGGKDRVELDSYDSFLLYALGLRLPRLDSRLTAAVKAQSCSDILASSLSIRILRLVRSGTETPIYLGHRPQEASSCEKSEAPHGMSYAEVHSAMAELVGAHGALLLTQPETTLSNGWNTRVELSAGSIRLDTGDRVSSVLHRAEEREHMNREFGRIYLRAFFELLAVDSRRQAPHPRIP
jgi:hypothetical protein